MSKVAFCFPGQGSFEAGMGRDIAEAVPAAMAVFERGSAASGLDLERLCFHAEAEELFDTAVQQLFRDRFQIRAAQEQEA